jgi:branched-chain amino acid transport system ATP-binding protein
MTVFENIIVGALSKHLHLTNAVRDAEEILEFTELTDKRSFIGSSLTVADRKRVELARALATGPKLLLLDEVMAGLNPTEIVMATNLIRKIRDTGVTILLVEHIMEVVMPLSEWVYVLDKGELIAEGIPKDVCCNKQVIKAYLGEQWDVENK